MVDNVIYLGGVTRQDIPVDRVLEGAKEKLEGVVLMGFTKDGELYFASTYADGGTVLWLAEKMKAALLSQDES